MKLLPTLLLLSLCFIIPSIGISQSDGELKLAKALEKTGRYEEALNIYYKKYDRTKLNIQVVNGISTCLKRLQKYDDLINFYQNLLNIYPHQFNYRVDLGKAYYLKGNEKEAFQNWRQVYESTPDNPTAYRFVAHALIEFRLLDEAIEVYQKAIDKFDNQKLLYRDIANLHKAQLNYNEAVKNLFLFYKYNKKQSSYIKSQLISISKDNEAVQKIINAILQFIDKEFSDDTIQELLATMYVKNKEYAKAFDIYKSVQNENKNPSALLTYASLVEKNKVYDYAVLAYETLIESFKSDKRIHQFKLDMARNLYKLALQQVTYNQLNDADINIKNSITILDELSKINQIMFRIRSLELKGDIYKTYYQDLDQAIFFYKQILVENNRSQVVDQIKIKLGHAFLIKNDQQEARKYYFDIIGKKYKEISIYNLAELDYFEGQFTKANNKYQKLISTMSPKDSLTNNILERTILLSQYAVDSLTLLEYSSAEFLERRLKKSEAAKKFLEIFQKQNILSFKAGIKASQLYKQLDKLAESESVLNTLILNYPENEGIDRAYYMLGEIYFQMEKYQSSLDNFQQILLKHPTSFYLEDARDKARTISGLIDKNEN
jgi:tetratricopeptide (TPR) repeat protein